MLRPEILLFGQAAVWRLNMCLAVPGRIVSIEGAAGLIDILGVKRKASLELIDNVKVGDFVLIHAGCAIEKVNRKEALKTIALFREITEEWKEI